VRFLRAIKTILLLAALVMSLPAMAFAHAGRHDTAPSGSFAASNALSLTFLKEQFRQASRTARVSRSGSGAARLVAHPSASEGSGGSPARAPCPPGVCCCHGASSCGPSSHCSAAMTATWAVFYDARSIRIVRNGGESPPYPEPLFGLDRPPKV